MLDKKVKISNQIWLNFFNEYLYNQGIITESERNKMINKISSNSGISIKDFSKETKVILYINK